MLTLVVGEKTNHLRMLVVKQKINTKRKKGNSAMIRPNRYHNSRSDNNRFNKAPIGYNKLNQSSSSANRSYGKNIFPGYSSGNSQLTNNNYVNNTGSVYHQSNKSSLGYNQLDQSSPSTTKHDSSLNSNCYNQSTGYMTDKLRSDIEKYILENQEVTFYIVLISYRETDKCIKLMLAAHYLRCLLTRLIFSIRLKSVLKLRNILSVQLLGGFTI